MPLHRPSHHGFSRAVWTIRNGMQVARMAVQGVRKYKKFRADRAAAKRKPAVVANVRSKLEMANPLYKNRDKLYRKDTPSGQKRRAVFAAQLKGRPRPVRSKTGVVINPNKLTRKPYSGKIPIAKGMTGAQVKRNIVRHEIKNFTRGMVKKNRGSRVGAAHEIRAMRNFTKSADYSKNSGTNYTRSYFKPTRTNKYVKAASRILSR